MWRYPLGSGGKRVCTRPLYLFVFRSSRTMSRTKFDGRTEVSVDVAAAASFGVGVDMIELPRGQRLFYAVRSQQAPEREWPLPLVNCHHERSEGSAFLRPPANSRALADRGRFG